MVEHEAAHVHVPGVGDLFWPALNFALFVFLLVKYLRGPIQEFFRARTQELRDGLAAGARAKRDAEALRAELKKDLDDLPALRTRLAQELKTMAEQQRDRLLTQARATAERIKRDAQVQAEQEVVAARYTLRQDVIGEALQAATGIVAGAVKPDDQARFVREFVAGAGNPS